MTHTKIVIFFIASLVINSTRADERRISPKRSGLCDRPQDRFNTVTEIDKYIDCLKVKSNRYGKRAYVSPLMQKLVPESIPDYYQPSDEKLQQLYDFLKYDDN